MPFLQSGSTGGGGLTTIFDSGYLGGDVASIDTGAAGVTGSFFDLVILGYFRSSAAATSDNLLLTFNNDSGGNYEMTRVRNANTTVAGTSVVAQTSAIVGNCPAASAAANVFGPLRVDVPAYAGTTNFKTGVAASGSADTTAANAEVQLQVFLWASAAAVTRLKVATSVGQIKAGSRLAVYGLGAA